MVGRRGWRGSIKEAQHQERVALVSVFADSGNARYVRRGERFLMPISVYRDGVQRCPVVLRNVRVHVREDLARNLSGAMVVGEHGRDHSIYEGSVEDGFHSFGDSDGRAEGG